MASEHSAETGRNIVVCCDGTSNEFKRANTNVVRLVQVLERNSPSQLVHYAPGVGTMPGPGAWSWFAKKVSLYAGLALGYGLTDEVQKAYQYLMNYWEPGDRVFLFGFSRGAYTVRVLAAMLHSLGLVSKGNDDLVPYAMRLFRSVRSRNPDHRAEHADSQRVDEDESEYWQLCDGFRNTFARSLPGSPEDRRFPVHFVGVWDTVSSVGWVWEPASFPYTRTNPGIQHIRHAVAIDERRAFFRQNRFRAAEGQDCLEAWFMGAHGDVGGGYADGDGGLWNISLRWMIAEAYAQGLKFDSQQLQTLATAYPNDLCALKPHDSLTWKWWPAEFFPKRHWDDKLQRRTFWINRGACRRIDATAILHDSVRRAHVDCGYTPGNLPGDSILSHPSVSDLAAPQ